jgi:flagellar hook assembly protein FlgD
VRVLADRKLEAGSYSFEWDGRNATGLQVATGVYFCRATCEDGAASGKVVLLR